MMHTYSCVPIITTRISYFRCLFTFVQGNELHKLKVQGILSITKCFLCDGYLMRTQCRKQADGDEDDNDDDDNDDDGDCL